MLIHCVVRIIWRWHVDFNIKFFHPYDQVPLSTAGGKKSIFARQIAAQRLKEGKAPLHCAPEHTELNLPPESSMDTDQCDAADDREQA